jgi:hypothetical protein
MNVRGWLWTITAGALVTFFSGYVCAADGMKLFTHASRGTIVSINAGELVLEHKNKGEIEVLHFVLTPETAQKGNLAVGAAVSVHYRIENNRHIVTSIQSQPANPARSTSGHESASGVGPAAAAVDR